MRIFAAASWVDGALVMRPLKGALPAVTRHLEAAELVWYHLLFGTTRMRRVCTIPEG